jgi:two-component system chemotaxis response regulator CheB
VLVVDAAGRLAGRARGLFADGALAPSGPGAPFAGALAAVRAQRPDALVVDAAGPGALEALGAIAEVMASAPRPILALLPPGAGPLEVVRAVGAGALESAERPETTTEGFWRALAPRVALLARVAVVRHVAGRRRAVPPAAGAAGAGAPGRPAAGAAGAAPGAPLQLPAGGAAPALVAVAASLGGPAAVAAVLAALPASFPVPLLLCQHITAGFTAGLAQWLDGETALSVGEAREGQPLEAGRVYVAPSDVHLKVEAAGPAARPVARLDAGPPLGGFRPACDALLTSAAEALGPRAVGVVLTGMGRDGARGLLAVRRAGGRTLVQDPATSAVWGMPGEAVRLQAAEQVLPLPAIAPELLRLVAGGQGVSAC